MNAKEKQDLILGIFYEKRNDGNIPINKHYLTDKIDFTELTRLCIRLYKQGFINGKTIKSEGDDIILLESHITELGIQVYENKKKYNIPYTIRR